VPDDREQAARAIADRAKAVRNPLPRGVWVLGIAIGVAGAILALVAVTRTPGREPTPRAPAPAESRSGFGLGIGIGLGAGIVVGFAIGRGRRPTAPPADAPTRP
jgi:drug/metabolite transporter (DMT)-like permease